MVIYTVSKFHVFNYLPCWDKIQYNVGVLINHISFIYGKKSGKSNNPKMVKAIFMKKYPLFPKIYSKTWQSPKSLCAYVPDLQGDMCDLVITGGGGTTPPSQVPFPLGQFASHLFRWKTKPKTAHNALNLKKILFPPRVIGRLLICLPSLGLTAHSAKKL